MRPNRSLRVFHVRFSTLSLLTLLLHFHLLQADPVPTTAEEVDRANLSSLNKQINELYEAGKLNEAIPIAQEYLKLYEAVLGPDNPEIVLALNKLGFLYDQTGKYAEAEPLYQRAVKIRETAARAQHQRKSARLWRKHPYENTAPL